MLCGHETLCNGLSNAGCRPAGLATTRVTMNSEHVQHRDLEPANYRMHSGRGMQSNKSLDRHAGQVEKAALPGDLPSFTRERESVLNAMTHSCLNNIRCLYTPA